MQIIDSRINTIDLRLAEVSSNILGLQTEQNRIKEYLFNRPQWQYGYEPSVNQME